MCVCEFSRNCAYFLSLSSFHLEVYCAHLAMLGNSQVNCGFFKPNLVLSSAEALPSPSRGLTPLLLP